MFPDVQLAVGAATFFVAVTAPFLAYWQARIWAEATMKSSADTLKKEVDAMAREMEAIKLRSLATEASLTVFRVDVAREYAPRGEMERLENRILDAIKGISERLDRVLERRPAGTN